MNAVTLNGKKHFVESCWEEVSVKKYIRIITEWEPEKDVADRDYFLLLNILTDNKFTSMVRSIDNELNLLDLLGWVVFQPFQFGDPPKAMTFHVKQKGDLPVNKTIDIPQNIKALPIGQNIHLRREIEKVKYLQECIPIAIGIYLQPLIDGGPFNLPRAKEIAKEVEAMPIHQVYATGFFLCSHAATLGINSERTWFQASFNRRQKRNGRSH